MLNRFGLLPLGQQEKKQVKDLGVEKDLEHLDFYAGK